MIGCEHMILMKLERFSVTVGSENESLTQRKLASAVLLGSDAVTENCNIPNTNQTANVLGWHHIIGDGNKTTATHVPQTSGNTLPSVIWNFLGICMALSRRSREYAFSRTCSMDISTHGITRVYQPPDQCWTRTSAFVILHASHENKGFYASGHSQWQVVPFSLWPQNRTPPYVNAIKYWAIFAQEKNPWLFLTFKRQQCRLIHDSICCSVFSNGNFKARLLHYRVFAKECEYNSSPLETKIRRVQKWKKSSLSVGCLIQYLIVCVFISIDFF